MLYAYHDFRKNVTGATLAADAQLSCDMILSELSKTILLNALVVKDALKSRGIIVKDKITSNELADLIVDQMAENLPLRKDLALIIYKAQPFEKEKIKGYKGDADVKKYKTAVNKAGFQTVYNIDKAKEVETGKQIKMVEDGIHALYTIMKASADKTNAKLGLSDKKIDYLTLIKQDLSSKINSYKTIYSMADGSGEKEKGIMGVIFIIVLVTGWVIYKYGNLQQPTPSLGIATPTPILTPTPVSVKV